MTTSTTENRAFESDAQPSDPAQAVADAIAKWKYSEEGAPFKPFLVKTTGPENFVNGWTAERGHPISFFGEYNGSTGPFLPLGDYASVNNEPLPALLLLAPMKGYEDALVHPDGFTWILDDIHSGNHKHIGYYWPIAPEGYKALGICVSFDKDREPDPTKYWCVKEKPYLHRVPTQDFWSDEDSHWTSHNGSLSAPSTLGVKVLKQQLLLTPTTMLSNKHGDLKNTSYSLALEKLWLVVDSSRAPDADYNANYGEGSTTAYGLDKVAVLPATMVQDSASNPSSLYYLAAQPRWVCTKRFSAPEGGDREETVVIGTNQETSSGFQNTTSLTVGAEIGIEAGPLSAKASVSYTNEMQLSGTVTDGSSSERSEKTIIKVPAADHVLIWQKQIDFFAYREGVNSDNWDDYADMVTYAVNDTDMTYSKK